MIDTKDNLIFRFGREETGTPVMSEYFGSTKWINMGVKNDFPQEILRLYQNSSVLHKSLIDRKIKMICGNGFENEHPFLLNMRSKDSGIEVLKKCVTDKVIQGGFYINIIFSSDRTEIVRYEHLPYEKMRIAKCDYDNKQNPDQLDGFYFSRDWLNKYKSGNEPIFVPEYSPMLDKELYPSQVLFFKEYVAGLDYYTLPSYNPALNALKTDYEISVFELKNLQNGLMPGMIIVNKSGMPTREEREEIYRETKSRYAGTENSGDFIMVYAETPDKAPDFIPVQLNNSDQKFKDLSEKIDSTIMRAHNFTNAIAGIEVAGKLGSSQEITDQLTYIQNTVISPLQRDIEDAFNKLLIINGSTDKLILNKYKIYADDYVPTTTQSQVVINNNK